MIRVAAEAGLLEPDGLVLPVKNGIAAVLLELEAVGQIHGTEV